MKKSLCFFLSIAVLVIFAAPGFADILVGVPEGDPTEDAYVISSPSTDSEPVGLDSFGLISWTQLNLNTIGFSPVDDGRWAHAFTGWSWRSGGTNMAKGHNINIPSGARIDGYTVWLHDNSAAGYIKYWFRRIDLTNNANINILTVTTVGQPGTVRQYFTIPGGHVVNNSRYAYYLHIDHSVTGSTLQNSGVTFWYKLQLSPAPASATFPDVPGGYWAFQKIEALARSGITVGYPDGQFKPDRLITRAEMAVFLAKALGLHWPDF